MAGRGRRRNMAAEYDAVRGMLPLAALRAQQQYEDQLAALREENIRWQDRCLAMQTERDKARAEAKQMCERLEAGTLHRLVCNADHSKPTGGPACICNPLKAEVARLEGLILRWWEHPYWDDLRIPPECYSEMEQEARRIRAEKGEK